MDAAVGEDDDLELYDELLVNDDNDRILLERERNDQFEFIKAESTRLTAKVDELQKLADAVQKQNAVLKRNISILYLTAKKEIDRKNQAVRELQARYDSLIFRRNQRRQDELTMPTHSTSSLSGTSSEILDRNQGGSHTGGDKNTLTAVTPIEAKSDGRFLTADTRVSNIPDLSRQRPEDLTIEEKNSSKRTNLHQSHETASPQNVSENHVSLGQRSSVVISPRRSSGIQDRRNIIQKYSGPRVSPHARNTVSSEPLSRRDSISAITLSTRKIITCTESSPRSTSNKSGLTDRTPSSSRYASKSSSASCVTSKVGLSDSTRKRPGSSERESSLGKRPRHGDSAGRSPSFAAKQSSCDRSQSRHVDAKSSNRSRTTHISSGSEKCQRNVSNSSGGHRRESVNDNTAKNSRTSVRRRSHSKERSYNGNSADRKRTQIVDDSSKCYDRTVLHNATYNSIARGRPSEKRRDVTYRDESKVSQRSPFHNRSVDVRNSSGQLTRQEDRRTCHRSASKPHRQPDRHLSHNSDDHLRINNRVQSPSLPTEELLAKIDGNLPQEPNVGQQKLEESSPRSFSDRSFPFNSFQKVVGQMMSSNGHSSLTPRSQTPPPQSPVYNACHSDSESPIDASSERDRGGNVGCAMREHPVDDSNSLTEHFHDTSLVIDTDSERETPLTPDCLPRLRDYGQTCTQSLRNGSHSRKLFLSASDRTWDN